MKILLSGLDAETCNQLLPIQAAENLTQWLTPADFVCAAESVDSVMTEALWVWLYRAPWTLLLTESSAETLAQWSTHQRPVLKLRRLLGQRLMLINVDRVKPTDLFDTLGLKLNQPISPLSPEEETEGMAVKSYITQDSSAGGEPEEQSKLLPPDMDIALAKLFEWVAPQYWDIFEALEAVAWLPKGDPIFRHDLLSPPAESLLIALGRMLRESQLLPAALDKIALQDVTISALEKAMQQGDSTLRAVQATHDDLKKELEQLQSTQQTAVTQAEEQRKQLEEENELLLLQLHQVQEELEKIFMESREYTTRLEQEKAAQAEQLKQVNGELGKARQALAESQNAAEQRKKEIEQLQQAQKATATEADKQHQQLEQENELLLLQLHQVQEELESYFLANRELVATMKSSQGLLNRTRGVISRLALNG